MTGTLTSISSAHAAASAANTAARNPPIAPSHVFPRLTVGARGRFPICLSNEEGACVSRKGDDQQEHDPLKPLVDPSQQRSMCQ